MTDIESKKEIYTRCLPDVDIDNIQAKRVFTRQHLDLAFDDKRV